MPASCTGFTSSCPTRLRFRLFSVDRAAAHAYVDHLLLDRPLTMVLEKDGHLLVAAARERGVTTFVAEVLQDDDAMLDVLMDAGSALTRQVVDGVVAVRSTPARRSRASHQPVLVSAAPGRAPSARCCTHTAWPWSGAERRGWDSGVRGSTAFGRGATPASRTSCTRVCQPSQECPWSRRSRTSVTRSTWPSSLSLPRALAAVADAADAGVPAAVVISSGFFQELGADGTRLQEELGHLARSRSIRVVGLNCLGVISNDPELGLNATFIRCVPPDGGLAVATQSGGVGIVLADLARELGLGIGSLISLGNKADVSGNDLLAAWTDDPRVTAGALYVESFGNARKFARLARRFAERKPLMEVVGGRSDGGRRAGASHTAATATPAVGVAALFAHAGVIGCDGAEDLAETALLMTREPLPLGPRLGVVSNAGGIGRPDSRRCVRQRAARPVLSERTRRAVARNLLGTAGTSNPVDAGATVAPDELATLVDLVLMSGEVDAVVVELVATRLTDPDPVCETLATVRGRHPGLPCVLVAQGMGADLPDTRGMTTYRSSAAAVRALGRAARYGAWLAERTADVEADVTAAGTLASQLGHRAEAVETLATDAGPMGWVRAEAASRLLDDYGLSQVGSVQSGPAAAAAYASSIGFPVVVKVADGDVVHRTERGLVRVGLMDAGEVERAVTSFQREPGRRDVPVLVQPVRQVSRWRSEWCVTRRWGPC